MKMMEQPVEHGREKDACHYQESHSRIQCIEGRENLSQIRAEGVDRAHAAEYHRGVHERIDPVKAPKKMISQYPNCQGTRDDEAGETRMTKHPTYESPMRNQRLALAFVQGQWERNIFFALTHF
jgi:hypothetical protein